MKDIFIIFIKTKLNVNIILHWKYFVWYKVKQDVDMLWLMFVLYIREDPCYDNGI